jgi:hypothetical protein
MPTVPGINGARYRIPTVFEAVQNQCLQVNACRYNHPLSLELPDVPEGS